VELAQVIQFMQEMHIVRIKQNAKDKWVWRGGRQECSRLDKHTKSYKTIVWMEKMNSSAS